MQSTLYRFIHLVRVRLPANLEASLVVALTFGVRCLYVVDLSACEFFAAPVVDAQTFVRMASLIAGGAWWGGEEVFWQPPLSSYFLATVMWAFPEPSFYWAARIGQALLSSGSALLLYGLARRCVSLAGAPTWTPLACGILFAFWGPLIYFDGELLAVSLEIFLYLLLINRCDRVLVTRRGTSAIAAGFVAGLAAITRPNILLFVVLTGAMWLLRERSLRRHALYFLAPLALVVGSATARNIVIGADIVAISSNGGINFYIGNNAHHDSTVAIRPGLHWENLVAEPEEAGMRLASERSSYYFDKATRYILHEPISWLHLMTRKTFQLLSGPERKRNVDPYHARDHSPLLGGLMWSWGLSFPFGLLSPVALLGLWASRHRTAPVLRLLRWFVLAYGLSVVLFFVAARYRAPLIPALLVFASYGVQVLVREYRSRRRRRWIPLGITAAIAILVNLPQAADPTVDPQIHHDLAEVALRRGDWRRAVETSSQAIALDPDYGSAYHNRAVARLQLGDLPGASQDATRALDLNPRQARSHVVLARVAGRRQNVRLERHHLQQALALDPQMAEAHFDLGRQLASQGQLQQALPHLVIARDAQPLDFWTHYELGRTNLQLGRVDSSVADFRRALQITPRVQGYTALAAAFMANRQYSAAIAILDTALQISPHDLHTLTNRGNVELLAGRPGLAIPWLQQALRVNPGFETARRGLDEALKLTRGPQP